MTAVRHEAGRVIAGSARGVRLIAPGEMTRPLSDRVKQALCAILEPALRGATILDHFAGSGAGGIAGLSRGADRAVFVEQNQAAVASITENLARAHLGGPNARIVQREAITWLRSPDASAHGPLAVALVDPPYDRPELLQSALELLGAPTSSLSVGALVVAKHFWRDQPADRIGLLASERTRRFGDTALTFYRMASTTEAQP